MKYKKFKLSLFLLLGMGLAGLHAQTAVPVTGGSVLGSGGSASYSIGQVVYTTNTGINGSVAQGIQQPYEISVVTGLDEAKDINLSASVYPNPATDFLMLRVENYKVEDLSYQLFDMNGKQIEIKKLESNLTRIDLNRLVPAIYFVKVTQHNKDVKTFKIIKN